MKIVLECEKPVAFDSPDHIMPWGTRRDNTRNHRFNEKLYKLYGKDFIAVLDLGCSGGGFVKDCHDGGCLAIGLEGSDYSKRNKRAEWATIPERLFTCDITRKFQLYIRERRKRPIKFDVITSWEVMEHIAEKDLAVVCENVKNHLSPGGLWITSISGIQDNVNGVDLHQTVQNKSWWLKTFEKNGLAHVPEFERYFTTQYVNGKFDNEKGFHVIVTNDRSKIPATPRQSIFTTFFDYWSGSRPQQVLKRFIVGW